MRRPGEKAWVEAKTACIRVSLHQNHKQEVSIIIKSGSITLCFALQVPRIDAVESRASYYTGAPFW